MLDKRQKCYPISPNSHIIIYFKSDVYKLDQKVANYFGYFCNKFVAQNFKKSPNLVAPIPSEWHRIRLNVNSLTISCLLRNY